MSPLQRHIVEYGVIGGILLVLALLLVPLNAGSQHRARCARCQGNLQQIGLALRQYHDLYGSFPPVYVADEENGRPIHSWRTLILPFLNQKQLYNGYWFREPWDGPNNTLEHRAFRNPLLPIFCPEDLLHRQELSRTNYFAVVGPHTAWPGEQPLRLNEDFPDGPERTILVVEVAGTDIHWLEPRDLNFDEMSFVLNDAGGKSISSRHHPSGRWPWSKEAPVVNVLFADGSVKSLPADTAPETIRALLTRDGGEAVKPGD